MVEALLGLALLLILAKFFGELCERANIPSILGELSAGIVLGPAILGFIDPHAGEFSFMAQVGIIMLLFVAGFEHVDIRGILGNKKISITLSAVSSFIPMAGVVLWGLSMGYPIFASVLLGVALSATSMGITVRSLLDCNKLNSKPGRSVIGALVLNDITGLIMLTLVLGLVSSVTGSLLLDIVYVVGGIVVFLLIFVIAELAAPYLINYAIKLKVEEALFTLVFVVVLVAAILAEQFGLSVMIGAFFAGIALSRSSILETETFSQKLSSISYGLFIPIFFAVTGAMIDLGNIATSGTLALMMLGVITTLQISCAFIVGKIFKFRNWEAVLMGLGMLPYAEVTLIVMSALLTLNAQGLIGDVAAGTPTINTLFSAVLVLIAMTILITPLAMKFVSRKIDEQKEVAE